MQLNFVDLFPTRVATMMCEPLIQQHPQWLAHIFDMRSQNPKPQGRSSRGGWNSENTLLTEPLFAPLKQVIVSALNHYIKSAEVEGEKRANIIAWANVHDGGGYNTLHMHPNNQFSGCYYLKVPAGAGAIVFRDPRYASLMSPLNGKANFCKQFEVVTPKEGQLLLFPSWLEHRVESNDADELRVSIAFNVQFV